jgi:hypothetical protein
MPRTLTRNSQVYPAGTYGPFSIDSFTKNDADRIEATLTVEGWPAGDLAVITMDLPGASACSTTLRGDPRDRAGNPLATVTYRLGPPTVQIGNQPPERMDMSGATITVQVLQAFRTALTFGAV